MSTDSCDCRYFEEGDLVEHRLNPDIFGIVVGEADFGRYYHVQLVGSLEIKSFHGVTLRHADFSDDEPPLPAKAKTNDGNVIDFTKEQQLRSTTKTRGAA